MIHGEVDPRRLLWMHQSCMIDVSKETAAKPLDQDRSDESLHLSITAFSKLFSIVQLFQQALQISFLVKVFFLKRHKCKHLQPTFNFVF